MFFMLRLLTYTLVSLTCSCPMWGIAATNFYFLTYSPAPAVNPLKGFFPYIGTYTNFPHSLEWTYLPLRSLMTGPTNINWASLENKLNEISNRGHQAIFRIYLDYPQLPTGIPQYLLDAGLVTHSYSDYGNNYISKSPDYENPLLRKALTNFVEALGMRYDGDPRIGFITVGLLGFWGEWHTYPHDNWFATLTVQDEVLNAYEAAFTKTKFLLRQPYGTTPSSRRMGYHDDSFAYSTIDPPDWHFLGALKAAGETNKWKTQPIGGEIRPEVQTCMWNTNVSGCVPSGQEYTNCVTFAHASWMLCHAAFEPGFTGATRELAIAGARLLGYELYVANAEVIDPHTSDPLQVKIRLRNLGVAPFYYDWDVQLCALNSSNQIVQTWNADWKLTLLLPAVTNTTWDFARGQQLAPGQYKLLLRVANPLTNGGSFCFANQTQDADRPGWLTLGQFAVASDQPHPRLSGEPANEQFLLHISGIVPGIWTVESSSNLNHWQPLFITNTSATNWTIMDAPALPVGFYRVKGSPAGFFRLAE
jgi:hypothetical protein